MLINLKSNHSIFLFFQDPTVRIILLKKYSKLYPFGRYTWEVGEFGSYTWEVGEFGRYTWEIGEFGKYTWEVGELFSMWDSRWLSLERDGLNPIFHIPFSAR